MANVNETTERREALQAAIKDYCQARGLTYAEFARRMGVGEAVIMSILHGRWHAVSVKKVSYLYNKVKSATQVFKTNDCAAVFETCNKARKRHLMAGLLADTGMGKTTALTAYAASKNTFYVCYDKSMNAKQFFASLLKEMGVGFDGSVHDTINTICSEVNALEEPLIIIDEAGKIPHQILMHLHSLRDKTNRNCGIVLAGMPYFQTNLIKKVEKGIEGYGEFYRRINLWNTLEGLTRNEMEAICKQYGITDESRIRELRANKRFGDLVNAIVLEQIMSED